MLAAELALCRTDTESFFDTTACFLTETTTPNAVGQPSLSGYTGTVVDALFRVSRGRKEGSFQAAQDGYSEPAEWQVLAPWGTSVDHKQKVLRGVTAWRGNYDAAAAYVTGDAVYSGGKFYLAAQGSTGQAVTEAAYWTELRAYEVQKVNDDQSNRTKIVAELTYFG